MSIFDLRMNGFSTETAVCLQTLHYNVLTGVVNVFYAQMINMINCSEVFTKSSAFQIRSDMSSDTPETFLF